jgi:hypothetical protein
MTNTQHKLNEASFFLGKLEQDYLKHPDFDYYLSAFISSARSVLWIMRSEYHTIEGWEDWYISKKPDQDEELFLKRVNEIRVRSEKITALKTGSGMSVLIPKESLSQELKDAMKGTANKHVKVTL